MPLPGDERYAFNKSIVSLVQWMENEWILTLCFDTKWAPPIEFYHWLVEHEDTIFFYANYCEPGCQVLGEFRYENWDFIDNFVWIPDYFYSATLDSDIFLIEPHELYYEYHDKDYVYSFEDYMKAMYDELSDTNGKAIEEEVQECAKQFNINLEDQYWTEFIEARIT
jgi:hypothetical protein